MFFKKREHKGIIGFHGLSDWWDNELTSDEKEIVLEKYSRYKNIEHQLIEGDVADRFDTPSSFLSNLATWFSTSDVIEIGFKMAWKGYELFDHNQSIEKLYQNYSGFHHIFSKYRNDEKSLPARKEICLRFIEIMPQYLECNKTKEFPVKPDTSCFSDLIWIFEKEGKYEDALVIVKKAIDMQAPGEWEAEIKRIERKQAKML